MVFLIIILQVSNQNSQQTVTIWAIVASIAAVFSAYSAFKSRGYAKRSLELSSRTYNDRQTNFGLYLIDSYRWTTKNEPKRKFLLFHLKLINKSDSKNTFKSELEIEYIRPDDSVGRAIVPHDENHWKVVPQKEKTTFSNDIRVEEKGMQSKWLIFEQPVNMFNKYRIEKYSIRVTDTQGHIETIESAIIKELIYE